MAIHSASRFGVSNYPAISREREFKHPEKWVAVGTGLQSPSGGHGRVLSVRIGVDFGTAYTKVAIQVADKVLFVPWSGTRNSEITYLLPGELTQMDDDSVWLGRSRTAQSVLAGLKLPFLLSHASTPEQQAATVAFLGLILRYVRGWLYHAHPSLVKDRRLVWQLSVGCPTNSWSSGSPRRAYEEIVTRGWQLSLSTGVITLSSAKSLLFASRVRPEEIGLDNLSMMPEFVAQIAGYVRSPQRRDGLHLLMDVGAGTVDLATFNVIHDKAKEEDRYPIFASEVLPLGTHFLMARRLENCTGARREWDDLRAIPGQRELAAQLNIETSRLEAADRDFTNKVQDEIGRVLIYTRSKRYGKAPEWTEGLPVFLSGGGSSCELYRRALTASGRICRVPFRPTVFPLLEEAIKGTAVGDTEFHRLSVAYGLTFDAERIGRIISPHQIEDAPRYDPRVDIQRDWLDRDDLYPK